MFDAGAAPSQPSHGAFESPRAEGLPLPELEARLTELAGHLNAATRRFLLLLAELDRREGWADGALDVRYLVDGAEVARRSFAGAEIACGADGLSLTARDRWRALPPKNTIRGPDRMRTTLHRVGGYMYVRTEATTRTRVLGVVPLWSTSVAWQRHEVDPE